MKQRALDYVKKNCKFNIVSDSYNGEDVPVGMEAFVQNMLLVMNDIKRIKAESPDTPVIKYGLRDVTTENLQILLEVLQPGTRHGQSEEKILQMLGVVFKEIDLINDAKAYLTKLQQQLVEFFVTTYIQEYSNYIVKEGASRIDNESFHQHVQSEIDRRAGAAEAVSALPAERPCAIS